MFKIIARNQDLSGAPMSHLARMRRIQHDRTGVILLAVLIFVAGLLPLITLVLTSINAESVSTAEAIKGAKTELGAEKSLNDSISLVVQEKMYPDYWTSVTQPDTAIIVTDTVTGYRRDQLPDVAPASPSGGAAGLDDMLGTNDDYWVGPRRDRSYIGGSLTGEDDNEASTRNYRYDFRYNNLHAPTYIGQSWSFDINNEPYARSPFTNDLMWMFNQFVAVDSDQTNPPTDDGYDVSDPYDGNANGILYGPGYYVGADHPRDGGIGGPIERELDSATIRQSMYNAKVSTYESVFTDHDRGPIPSNLLKSYANISDEAGRLNLNIFLKKLPVLMTENANTDYDFEGYGTSDFNYNTCTWETGFKWVDNPLFPDAQSTLKLEFNPLGTDNASIANPTNSGDMFFLSDNFDGTTSSTIDFGGIDFDPLATSPFTSSKDGEAMPSLGESVQHYYEGDTDNDGISESVESMIQSIRMLIAVPGIDPTLAANILEYLNPSLDYFYDLADDRGYASGYYIPGDGDFIGSNDEAYVVADEGIYREDVCNVTPQFMALNIDRAGGIVNDFNWDFTYSDYDDLPLPQPNQLKTLDDLLGVPGMTRRKFDRIKEHLTIFSYDTNYIGTNIYDVSPSTDLVNAYQPGDPAYNGSFYQEPTEGSFDTDDLADLRFDISRFTEMGTVRGYRGEAEEMYAYIRAHLPKTMFDKITLPAVDRLGRSSAFESYIANNASMFDLANGGDLLSGLPPMVPHRDDDDDVDGSGRSHAYNIGVNGHEEDITASGGTFPGSGYPAMNPEFTLDSCLSIVMYRNGTLYETDDYTYSPTGGAWLPYANRIPPFVFGFLPPQFFGLFGDLFVNNDPDPDDGPNVNPHIRPHATGGSALLGVSTPQDMLANFLMPGSFDSAADLLDVPLYGFDRMSVSLLSDPPSDFRYDVNNNGIVDGGHPEQGVVRHYITFSDVVNMNWYMENVHPLGPNNVNDGGFPNGDDPDMNQVLYEIRFTAGNHGGITTLPDQTAPDTGDYDCLIPLTPLQLRAIGGGMNSTSVDITIVAYDNQNNLSLLGPQFTSSLAFSNIGGAGDLETNFQWNEVPEPEDPVGSHPLARPDNASDWPAAQPADWEKWAYDSNGDPYVTARVEVVRADGGQILDYDTPDRTAVDVEDIRCDEKSKIYLQYNEENLAPLRVDMLPVRVSSDQFEIRSSVGGYSTDGGAYLLYDWGYENGLGIFDFPSGYDGVWPLNNPQDGQALDPRTVRITPDYTDIVLRVYDLRRFEDTNHAPFDTNPPDRVAPTTSPNNGYPDLTVGNGYINGLWDDGIAGGILGRVVPPNDPLTGLMGFPSNGTGPNGYMDPNHPDSADFPNTTEDFRFDYAENRVEIEKITGSINVEAQVATDSPTAYLNNTQVRVFFGGAGGQLAYDFRIRILDGLLGSVPGFGVGPYEGPDGAGGGLWPTPAPRRTRLIGSGLPAYAPYDDSTGGVIRVQNFNNFNELSGEAFFDLTGIVAGQYWVEVLLTDSTGIPDYAYTKIVIGTNVDNGSSTVVAPEMNASINVAPLEVFGAARIGFQASVGVDGGSGNNSYYWALTRPTYSDTGDADTIIGEEIVDSSTPFIGIDSNSTGTSPGTEGFAMVSNDATPTFEFHAFDTVNNDTHAGGSDGIRDANGVYFLHCYVMDQANTHPASAEPFIAHDVAMVTIADPFGGGGLETTPMAILAADSPGNRDFLVGDNSLGQTGDPLTRPTINPSGITPSMAANGDVITIDGTNFNTANPANNIVRFGNNVTAAAFSATATQLLVVVPAGATLGYVNVTIGDETSNAVFFQTGYNINFDLIGGLQLENKAISFEIDYQGDGTIDDDFTTLGDLSLPAQVRGIGTSATQVIRHDYAQDGIGNYTATLYIRDNVGNRRAVSHQLITIGDRNLSTADNNGMLVNAWPDIEMRSETFTASPDRGVEFESAIEGQPAQVEQKWSIDSNNADGTGQTGGLMIAAGSDKTTDITGRQLYDPDVDFTAAGVLGVQYQDLVINVEGNHDATGVIGGVSGATADVSNLIGLNTVVMQNPLDPSDGLSGGNLVTRSQDVTAIDIITAGPGGVVEIESNSPSVAGLYDWVGNVQGLTNAVFEGGFLVGDDIRNQDDGSLWEIQALVPANNNGFGWAQLLNLEGAGGVGTPGRRDFTVTGATNVFGLPPRFELTTSANIDWNTLLNLFPGGVGLLVYNGSDSDAVWRLVDVPAVNGGTLASQTIQVEHVSGGTAPPNWANGDAGYIFIDPQWTPGDTWYGAISGDEWRVGFAYQIFTDGSSGSGGSGVEGSVYADADYATEDAVVDFYFDLEWPYALNTSPTTPTEVHVDWNGDGAVQPEDEYPVGNTTRFGGGAVAEEHLMISHNFYRGPAGDPLNEYNDPSLAGSGQRTNAQFWILVTPSTMGSQMMGPYDMPVIRIGGDDYDNDLTRLNVRNYNAALWHRVTTEVHTGANTLHASDAMYVPPGNDFSNTMQTFVSYNNPSVTRNTIGETTMRHQGVHGIGGSLNWMSDANADSVWQANNNFASPLAYNAVNHHEFRFQNGPNAMTPTTPDALFTAVRGNSFPAALPGVGVLDTFQFIYYQSSSGIYNGYGFITDNLPSGERTFSFDSQPLMLGELPGGGGVPNALPLGADFKVEPQVGTTSQLFSLDGYISGTNVLNTYNYGWVIDKVFDPMGDPAVGPVNISSPTDNSFLVFSPLVEIQDEPWYVGPASVHGRYRARFVVNGVTTGTREFWVEPPAPAIYVMADPPSASDGDQVDFYITIEGGVAPFVIDFDFDDGTTGSMVASDTGTQYTFSHVFTDASPNRLSPDDEYNVVVTWTDSVGDTQTANTVVKIADSIPLNANVLVDPPSGVAPFVAEVHYSVAGGNRMANDGYNVSVILTNSGGGFEDYEFRTEQNTFGSNNQPDDPRDPNADDDPVIFTIPAPGNYQVRVTVTDNNGQLVSADETIFAAGYLRPIEYGLDKPQVVRDKEDRPMHAVRIWTDPFLSRGTGSNEEYENRMDGSNFSGGRLMEADLQVFGDIITVDPNPSFRSIGMNSTADPYAQDLFFTNFNDLATQEEGASDFYDTFTVGRININTASEATLTSLFRKIKTSRGYRFNEGFDTSGDGSDDFYVRTVRNPATDVYLTQAEARALAQDVIRYRTMYFDMYKGQVESSSDFGYRLDSNAGGFVGAGLGDFRVDHLPVIGPWDGVNPRLYDIDDRDADLGDANDDLTNTFDHMAGSYYNFDPTANTLPGGEEALFYSPTDVAVVRDRIMTQDGNAVSFTITSPIFGTFQIDTDELVYNYAKYLNDVVTNGTWESGDRGTHWSDWADTGLYPDSSSHYSQWAFDSRNYFTYDSGSISVDLDSSTVTSTNGYPAEARNNISIIQSNGETAYTYIPNPPFRSLFDLYKVIDSNQAPNTYRLENVGARFAMEVINDPTSDYDGMTPVDNSNTHIFSGPSRFRYVARWDDHKGEFIPLANYLDDIAPYVTCRSYVFRVESIGAINSSGGSAGAMLDSARVNRDRVRAAVLDVGPFWARRDAPDIGQPSLGDIRTFTDKQVNYNLLWYHDDGR